MANPWTVQPEVITLSLQWTDPTGVLREFWVKIKKFLTVGEERVVQTAGWKGVRGGDGQDAEINIDWKATSFARAMAYLVDWNLESDPENHVRMPLNASTLQNLHPEVFELIENAITAHVKAMENEKKARTGSPAPIPTSA